MNSTENGSKQPALYSYTQIYSNRRQPILVCPRCKRHVIEMIATKNGKPYDVYRCREHGDVVAILSEICNEY